MTVNHNLSMDLTQPGPTPRLHIKQGDHLTHRICLNLTCDGERWMIPEDAYPLIRFRVHDPETGQVFTGAYDELPSGNHAYECTDGVLTLILSADILCIPGLMTADVLLRQGDMILSTLDFEIWIQRPPVEYTDTIISNYYAIASLDQINQKFSDLSLQINALRRKVDALG